MIRIHFREPDSSEWNRWKSRSQDAQEAHNREVESGRDSKVRSDLYKAQKEAVYINRDGPFHGKCAYCESDVYKSQHGDIEHFRPIHGVEDEAGKPISINISGASRPHPGYYWLAYAWDNLLLSCTLCNRLSRRDSKGRLIGKQNQFPVRGFRAIRPGEEAREDPLLINPVMEDPSQYLEIDKFGILKATEKKGGKTIAILGLNERDLPNARKSTYEQVKQTMSLLVQRVCDNPNSSESRTLLDRLNKISNGLEEHTLAARKAIKDSLKNLRPIFKNLVEQ